MPTPNPTNPPRPATATSAGPTPGPEAGPTPLDSPAEQLAIAAELPEVPGYEMTGEIARGGMGVVYAACDLVLNREVAVKTLLPQLGNRSETAEQFDREARLTAQLPHPGVPPVHAMGKLADGRPFLAMKLIRGRTLAAILANGGSGQAELLAIFEQICQTVGFAHSNGIIHRDLKPHNVMVGAFGEVQVMDWGLARELASVERPPVPVLEQSVNTDCSPLYTEPGQIKGTPAYMAPEQARGEAVDARTDVFALGAILCQMLTGRPPYTKTNQFAVIRQAGNADLADAFTRLGSCGADAELVALCKQCLSAKPNDRPETGKAVADAVAAHRAGVERRLRQAETDRAAAAAEAREQRKRRKVQLALAIAVGFLMLGGVGFAWWQNDQKQKAARKQLELEREQERAKLAEERAKLGVTANIALAADLKTNYRYREAREALEQASGLLPATDSPELREQLQRAIDDLEFVRELDTIRMKQCTFDSRQLGYDWRSAAPAYLAAFSKRGFDIANGDPRDLARRIQRSPIRNDLVAALDDWSVLETDRAILLRVATVSTLADPGPWLDAFRDPDVRRNPLRFVWLVATARPEQLSAGTVTALAKLMTHGYKFDPRPLLLAAQFAHPQDFLIPFELAMTTCFPKGDDDVPGARTAALPYLRAARSIRPDNLAVLVMYGFAMVDEHNFGALASVGREAIRVEPSEPTGYALLAIALASNGDSAGAVAAGREVVRLAPNRPESHRVLAGILSIAGDLEGAAAEFREALRLEPGSVGVQLALAETLFDKHDYAGTAAACRVAIKLHPADAKFHRLLGASLKELGDADGAIAAYHEAARLEPDKPDDHNGIGAILSDLKKDYPAAVEQFRRAISLDPKFALAHANLGNTLRRIGELAAAEAALHEATRLVPTNADYHHKLGTVCRDKRDYDAAITAFREAIRLDPRNPGYHTDLGAILCDNKGLFDDALACFEEAIRLNPKLARAYSCKGVALNGKNRVAESVAALTEAVRLDPTDASTYANLGFGLLRSGKLPEAIAACEEAIRLNPNLARAHSNLGQALLPQGKLDRAVAAFRRVVELEPNDAKGYANLGAVYLQQEKWRDATEAGRKAVELAPKYPNGHALLGMALLGANDIPGARKALTEAARLDPKYRPLLGQLPLEK